MANSMMRFKGGGRARGFTLLEALISLLLVTAGLLAAYRFNSTTIAFSAESNVRAYALAMAEAKLEELRNFKDGDGFDALVVDGGDAAVDYASARLIRSWERDEGFGNSDTLRQVEVTVAWDDRLGVGQSVVLSSIIWRHNPGKGAKDLFLALNSSGNSVDGFVDSSGGIPDEHGGGKLIIYDPYLDNGSHPETSPDGYVPTNTLVYDVEFEGDILFTDQGLEGVSITKGDAVIERYSMCVVVEGELHYTCYIYGIPDGGSWSGTLDFDPAGNNHVCEPSTQSIAVEGINQSSPDVKGLSVVVMKNSGSCPR